LQELLGHIGIDTRRRRLRYERQHRVDHLEGEIRIAVA
jgi:hypothetical protein